MKKVLFLALTAIITSVVISSCSHDDSYDSTYTLLSKQSAQIDSFVSANALNMTSDQISYASGVMSDLYSWGDTTRRISQDSSVIVFKISVWGINNQLYYTSDSTLKFDFVNTTNNSTLVNSLVYSTASILYYYLEVLGPGGQIDFITPSIYQYGSNSITLDSETIPANSPIYYQLQIENVTTSSAAQ